MKKSGYFPHDATVFPNFFEKTNSIKSLIEALRNDYPIYYQSYQADFALYNFVSTKTTNEIYIGCEGGSIIQYDLETHQEKSIYKYHNKGVVNLKISNLDSYLLSASHDGSVAIFDVIRSKFFKSLSIIPSIPETICFTHDEEAACIGGNDHFIRIWRFVKDKKEIRLVGHAGPIVTLLIVKEKFLISSSFDTTIKIWDLNDYKEKGTCKGHKSSVNCFIVGNQLEMIASGGGYSVKLWNMDSCDEICNLIGHVGEIYSLAFNFDDSLLASGSQDRTVRIWNTKNKTVEFIQDNHLNFISYIRFVGKRLLVSASYRNILVDNYIEKRTEVVLEGHTGMITQIEVVSGGSKIISCSFDRTLKFWDINDKDMKKSITGHSGNVSCLLITNDNKFIVSGGWDTLVIVWKLKEPQPLHILRSHSHYISCLSQTNDGRRVVSASWDSQVKIWEVSSGILIHTYEGPSFSIHHLKLSFFSEFIGCCSGDYKAWFWNLESFNEVSCLSYSDVVSYLDFNLDDTVVLGVLDGSLDSFNLKKNQFIKRKKFHCEVYGFRFSADFSKIIVVLSDKSFQVVDSESFDILLTFGEHSAKWPIMMSILTYSYFIIVSGGNEIKIFDIKRKIEYFSFKSSCQIQTCVSTGCGNFILAGTMSGSIIIFNVSEKRVETTFKGHTDLVSSICLTDLSKYLISGSRDTTLKIWKLSQLLKDVDHTGPEETSSFLSKSHDHRHCSHYNSNKNKNELSKSFESYEDSLKLYPALTYNGFRQRFNKKLLPVASDCKIMMAGQVNLAHVYAYLGFFLHLQKALEFGCGIRRDSYRNSPLYYSIAKDSKKSTDVILQFLIDLSKSDDDVQKFFEYSFALRDDLFKLLKLASPLVTIFLESIFFVTRDKSLPNSVRCFIPPVVILTEHSKIYFDLFRKGCKYERSSKKYEHFVEFRTTPFEFDLTNGSKGFFRLIKSLTFCKNKKIFSTKLIKTILDYKFTKFYRLILLLSLVLALNLLLMILCISQETKNMAVCLSYFVINSLMLFHEVLQLKYEGFKIYHRCQRNLLDILSVSLTLIWVFCYMINRDIWVLKWLMVFLNFIKGLNIFKAFNATRFYIALLTRVIQETYSFLIIFLYSTLAFGALYIASVGLKFDKFIMLWKTPYELNFGVFDSSSEANIEYLYFVLASLLNIVMMLNLLIAILSDSFDKFQIEALEFDYREKMDVITEIESLFLLFKSRELKGFLQLCDYDLGANDEEPWGGKIKEIELKIERISREVEGKYKKLERNQSIVLETNCRIERMIEKKHEEVDDNFAKINKKLDEILGLRDKIN